MNAVPAPPEPPGHPPAPATPPPAPPDEGLVPWHAAADGALAAHNASWGAFTGQTGAQYAGWGWLDAVHADDRERVRRAWGEAVAARAVFLQRYRLRRHDGAWRDVAAQGMPVLVDGRLREWVGLCTDETAARRAQEALRASEERLAFLDRLGEATRGLTDATELMAVTARLLGEHLGATRCAYADVERDNDRFTIRADWSLPGVPSSAGVYSLDLFGPQAGSLLRRGDQLVVCDVDRELGDGAGARMFNAIGIKAIVCAGLVKGERLVAMMAVHQAAPRRWTAQDIAIVAEVVERCWAHIERVRDRAALREQDRRKDEFLATLAHELRNPLAPIRYAIRALRLSTDPARRQQAEDVVDRQAAHMARLIDDLLDVSRINRGLIQLQREVVPLRELMLRAVEAAMPALEGARHRLELRLPGPELRLHADPARIVQVIDNLLTNAAKYTPDGGEIGLAAWSEGERAVLEVVDNGIGIPPDEQGRLFTMFTQLGHTAQRARGGLGIGLALVRTLAELHGGSVRVHSAGLDEGTRFTLSLPLHRAVAAPEPASPAERAPQCAGEQVPPAGRRVLAVEDNADGLAMLSALLEAWGYRVAGAADGGQAVELARSFAPEVVLLDLGLPGMDGYQVAQRLRAAPATREACIIALTGWGAESDRARTRSAGFDAHLTKPVEPQALRGRLAAAFAALDARSPACEAGVAPPVGEA